VFLNACKGGSPIIDANFQANLAVARAFGAERPVDPAQP